MSRIGGTVLGEISLSVHEYTNVSVYFRVKMGEKWGNTVLDKGNLAVT
jgi:hypothetical protein